MDDLPVGEPRPGDPSNDRTVISTTPDGADDRHAAEVDRLIGRGRRRRQLPWAILGVVVVLGGMIGLGILLDLDDTGSSESVDIIVTSTVGDSVGDVGDVDTGGVEYVGELGSAELREMVSAVDGTITSAASVGVELRRGDVLALVDGSPVVVFYGDVQPQRDLAAGDEGDDVLQLESNLAALGFDSAGTLSVDGVFTAQTADAVAAWKASIGLAVSGDVPLGLVAVIDGPLFVTEAVEPGTPVGAGDPIVRGELRGMTSDLVQRGPGVVTDPLAPGTAIAHGDALHRLDGLPVIAVTESSEFITVVLDALATGDVEELEAVLVFFGHDPDGVIVIDSNGDLATLAAFGRWQVAVGLPETLAMGEQYYIELPPDRSVEEVFLVDPQAVDGGALVYSVGSSTLSVSADIPVDDASALEVGDPATVVTADGQEVEAAVTATADPTTATTDADGVATVRVTFALIDEPAGLASGTVKIRIGTG
jgi:peptidoglycan hydrolase-like protein with peptidoglycan-binding domain